MSFLWLCNRRSNPAFQEATNNDEDQGVQNTDNNQNKRTEFSIFIDQTEKKCPRLYNIVFMIIVPLLFLVCIAMICGHFLAVFERQSELDSLNSSLEDFIEKRGEVYSASEKVQSIYNQCLEEYITNYEDDTDTKLMDFIDGCKADGLKELSEVVDATSGEIIIEEISGKSFNWNRCFEDGIDYDNYPRYKASWEQALNYYGAWLETYLSNFETIGHEAAVSSANDITKESCQVNSGGGAMFWFTIMTTIGYGNTAPVTASGRALVYTMGFLSILMFTACIGMADYVLLTIVDDFFIRVVKMKRLTKGFLSVFFWFCIFVLWIFLLASISALYQKARYNVLNEPLSDRIWWAYISLTTVGFGDFHIAHDTFQLHDMLYVPLLLLLGFVFLANFLLKLSEVIFSTIQKIGLADDEDLSYLLRQEEIAIQEEHIDNDEAGSGQDKDNKPTPIKANLNTDKENASISYACDGHSDNKESKGQSVAMGNIDDYTTGIDDSTKTNNEKIIPSELSSNVKKSVTEDNA